MAKRKTYTTKFKKQVALEAIKEHLTIPQIAQKFNVHPSQIKTCKRILTEDRDSLFEHGNRQKNKPQDGEKEKDNLLRIIGKLQVAIEFLNTTLE